MKNLLKTIIMGCLITAVVSCGKNNKRQPIQRGRNARGIVHNTPGTTHSQQGTSWGVITSQYQEQFSEAFRFFLSSTVNVEEIGNVSGEDRQNTGVRFFGHVETENSFNYGRSHQQIRLETAEIQMIVWDSFAGKKDANGQLIPAFSIRIKGAESGYVRNGRAKVTFKDAYGSITLKGWFRSGNFLGSVEFENHQYWDGVTPGAKGILGDFQVRTCGFFKCDSTN